MKEQLNAISKMIERVTGRRLDDDSNRRLRMADSKIVKFGMSVTECLQAISTMEAAGIEKRFSSGSNSDKSPSKDRL